MLGASCPLGCGPRASPVRPPPVAASGTVAAESVRAGMKRAARYMTETVSYRGAYLWSYMADFSRVWGELEAKRSMLWLQPPGTPSVGHVLLDAFHATGDEYYYEASRQVASALMAAQLESGGWNYVFDFAGEASLREWYSTVARNAWRLEEFHQHPGSSTFDDACTATAGQFLLRMALERDDPDCHAAFGKVLRLLEQSQGPTGGGPQRYPLREDYTRSITFNDDVIGENIKLLLLASQALSDPRLAEQARAAMDCMLSLQQPAPQPGWALQHSLDGQPAAARSFEPRALATHTTAKNVAQLLSFYELTGDAKYLARLTEALDWLDRVRLPPELARTLRGTHPTFIEVNTNRPSYVHRRGSNVANGAYYHDAAPLPHLSHYSNVRQLDVPALRHRYRALLSMTARRRGSPAPRSGPLPPYFTPREPQLLELAAGPPLPNVTHHEARSWVAALGPEGAWLTPLEYVSNPYRGPASTEPFDADTYESTHVGDRSDTSPYRPAEAPATYTREPPPMGISVGTFVERLGRLVAYLARKD